MIKIKVFIAYIFIIYHVAKNLLTFQL